VRFGKILILLMISTAFYASVLDDFKLLPNSVIEPFPGLNVKEWMLDQRRGSIIDIEHGFIYAQGDGGQPSLTVVKWKQQNILLVTTDLNDIYGPLFKSFRVSDEKLTEIKMEWYNPNRQYVLPRYGKDIVEYDENFNVTAIIRSNGNKFEIHKL
jgi:hypothetical protein